MRIWNCFYGYGGICPKRKTAEMTQDVGVDQDGRLYTKGYDEEVTDLDERVAALEQGGGDEPITGTGTLHDEYANIDAGTYDYLIQGKLLTVTLHIPTAPQSVGLALTLVDLPAVEFDNQNFSVVYNEFSVATVTAMRIQFYQSSGKTYVNALDAGNSYVSNLVNANNYTFTIRIK